MAYIAPRSLEESGTLHRQRYSRQDGQPKGMGRLKIKCL